MSKKVDSNGYWYIKHNPISKEGVFPYLGHTISEECEPNKVYKVYRSAKVLEESVPTWDNPPKPFIDDHEMLGEGFTAIDDRPVQGIIYNPECKNGVLYADIAVYSEDLKQNIENGKKELSLGYFCKYKKERGVFKGEVYDYVQYDMIGNHIALVDAGRCGSDVKVFDHKCTMDSLDLGGGFEKEIPLKNENENAKIDIENQKEVKMAKYITVTDAEEVLKEKLEDDKVKEIVDALEEKAEEEKKSEDSEEEEEKKAEDKCGKDEDEEKKSEDSDDEEEEKKSTEDSLKELMSVVKDMADDVKKLVAGKAQDEDEKEEKESEDESEEEEKEEKAEDSDDDEEKTSEDSAVFVFGADSAIDSDEALTEYLK